MTAARTALLLGLGCSIAVVVWAAGDIVAGSVAGSPADEFVRRGWPLALAGLWVAQAMALAVVAPWYALHFGWRESLGGLLTLLLVPLPLLALSWLTGAASLQVLGSGVFAMTLGALLIFGFASGMNRLLEQESLKSGASAALQFICVAAVFAFRGHWSAWLSL